MWFQHIQFEVTRYHNNLNKNNMIECCLKNRDLNDYIVILPHEINNEFLGNAGRAARAWKISGVHDVPSFWDFGNVEFPPEKLDQLFHDFDTLEKNLDEITKIVPLPKMVWCFDGILFVGYRTNVGFDNYVELWTWGWKYFDKDDFLYLISLIKKKILEAKEKNETLVFSGD